MSYIREIPRDLFNEANLLKCLGKLWICLDNRSGHCASLDFNPFHPTAPFDVWQSQDDGSISARNVLFSVSGRTVRLYRPLNSREPWPLYADFDDEPLEVFTDGGELSGDFLALIAANVEQ